MDHKEMAAIAADWLAGRQPEDDGVPMENMVVDDPAPTPSSAPSSPKHCAMTIADAAYNHHLPQEHLQAEEQVAVERAEQEALLDSYRSAREGRLVR